jgi:hypothetical protein
VKASNQDRGFDPIPSPDELPEPTFPNNLSRPESILEGSGSTKPDFPMPKNDELRSTDPPSDSTLKSPSDSERLPSQLERDDDLNFPDKDDLDRRRARAKKSNTIQCDDVRQRAAAANIGSIDLDVAPNFGITSKDKVSPEEKRRDFAMKAPVRSWYDQSGSLIAEGKLVDFNQNWLVIETLTGSQQRIDLRTLSDADAAYAFDVWNIPVTCAMGGQSIQPRIYEATTTTWKASGLCHKPLYFEEIQLERSGHEHGPILQPAISTAHFFKNIAFLPYKMGIHPMNECQYALGHYRPGNCAPWSIEPVPLSLRGLASQAKAVTGTVLAFP